MGPRKTASGYLAGMGQISGGEGSSIQDTVLNTWDLEGWHDHDYWQGSAFNIWTRKSPTFITALSCGPRHLLQQGLIFFHPPRPLLFSPFPFPRFSGCLKMSAHTHGSPSLPQTSSASTTGWTRKLAKAPSVSSSRVRLLPLLHQHQKLT